MCIRDRSETSSILITRHAVERAYERGWLSMKELTDEESVVVFSYNACVIYSKAMLSEEPLKGDHTLVVPFSDTMDAVVQRSGKRDIVILTFLLSDQ